MANLARNHAHIHSLGMLVVIIVIVWEKNATMSTGAFNEKVQVKLHNYKKHRKYTPKEGK